MATPTPTRDISLTATQGADAEIVRQQLAAVQSAYPVEWPMQLLTDQQVDEAGDCHMVTLFEARYKKAPPDADLAGLFRPVDSCDWAVLAAAYNDRAEQASEPAPEIAYQAYLKAINDNPALLLTNSMFFGFFERGNLVKAPPFAATPLKSAMMRFSFGGIGYQSETTIFIGGALGASSYSGSIYDTENGRVEKHGVLDPALISSLGRSLTDLVPIQTEFHAIACYDFYPSSEVLMVYEDGTTVFASTHGNFLGGGGPWEVTIDGQPYIQASSALPKAVDDIGELIGVPGGKSYAMACYPAADMLTYGFPE